MVAANCLRANCSPNWREDVVETVTGGHRTVHPHTRCRAGPTPCVRAIEPEAGSEDGNPSRPQAKHGEDATHTGRP